MVKLIAAHVVLYFESLKLMGSTKQKEGMYKDALDIFVEALDRGYDEGRNMLCVLTLTNEIINHHGV